ncbi:KAP family P-loop NTPase fold protein [Candidatus Nitrosotenuis sp. DW1]|uniref:KAP family P-loop NTPase fold protein n=1 Tax=Candidatus Nitrosotenuis sp. DW1 TaxID=2259672 RepID=UPI0015C6AFC2|nr:P-loop NTPase fold protein [Candidatus Nitrosotenuis sp. DW1]QLH09495.1 hypothetical protein DSQ19_08435 [Candidatus Nitrosotenuis sp. DW1]
MVSKVKILTDDIELDPTKDFVRLSDTIVSFITGSDPRFSVGIYGDWGTGKSTLMRLVEKKLNENNDKKTGKTLTIWFNAWRYEREEQVATIALLKTIAYAMSEHDIYKNVAKSIWNAMKTVGKDWAKQAFTTLIASEEAWNSLKTNLNEKMKLLQEAEKETIYFDGIRVIESEIEKILEKDSESRIVVFIDDLDRCSPQKVLEVLESIKVFFDMKGFVFIVGLSDRTVTRLITKYYDNSGINGEDYIQKIIQLPIRIPPWNSVDIEKIIETKVAIKLDKKYADFIKSKKAIIGIAVQPNPRELKRFINNIIVALEIYAELLKNNLIKEQELLILEALKWRWNEFYEDLMSSTEVRTELNKLLNMSNKVRESEIRQLRNVKEQDLAYVDTVVRQMDVDLWKFLTSADIVNTFLAIRNWDVYRRVAETTKVIPKIYLDRLDEDLLRGVNLDNMKKLFGENKGDALDRNVLLQKALREYFETDRKKHRGSNVK